ncbi:hypothetical protein BTH42_08290 [Burkholderia sp. SRS-W-2-2016]|uniref:response regulator transcription factor n=1 Tax=Burkholderia sp. SRS-W-2-2016 TaxID=1926878 RepID=UPI00094AB88F|nr:response regulator [Burkholderia sp. SRS-W-2-2016]OLL32425.1 hypothetical protein BTH42_08290 [Burkholderia sp. SRS-W-2-2016]
MSDTKPMVVLVEDDDGMRGALQRLLKVAGFQTRAFESAEALLAADGAKHASCLVLDVQLPGVSGTALYESLAGERPPVVFITAYNNATVHVAVAAFAGATLLIKPFLGTDLLAAIARVSGASGSP